MRLLTIQNQAEDILGGIGTTARSQGFEIVNFCGAEGDPLPKDASDFDGLIILGGWMDATADDQRPYFPSLLHLIREYTLSDKPVLGVCLGAQLIARAFGGRAWLNGKLEFGFHAVEPTLEAANDPVLSCLKAPTPLFEWHTDHFDLPVGAVHLATNTNYPYQAFRLGRATYGIQFHFETDQTSVKSWLAYVPNLGELAPGYDVWLPKQFSEFEEKQTALCRELTGRWLALAK